MCVLQAIIDGLLFFLDSNIAWLISTGLCPSISHICHPADLNRSTWLVESDNSTFPSIVMLLLSQKTINFDNFCRPAKVIAS